MNDNLFGKSGFAIISSFIMIMVAMQSMITSSLAEQGAPPIDGESEGDWVIEAGDNVTRSMESIFMNGNITIQGNANLTLDNVTISFNCSSNGDYYIEVLPGGTLNIINRSVIKSTDPLYNIDFYYRVGSKGVIQDSTIRDVGYSTGGSKGVRIEENNISVEQSLIIENYIGILAYGSDPSIFNNNISNNEYGLYYKDSFPAKSTSTNVLWNNMSQGTISISSVNGGLDSSLLISIPNGAKVQSASINITAENTTGIGYLNESYFDIDDMSSYSNISNSYGDLRIEKIISNVTETNENHFNDGTLTNLSVVTDSLMFTELSWTKMVKNGKILDVGENGKFDDAHVVGPTVLKQGNTINMWYYGRDAPSGAYRIGNARTTDPLLKWARQNDGDAVLNLGSNGQWDDVHILAPTVIKEGFTYKMWYSGYDGSKWQIGYATSSDGITWSKSGSNPVLSKGSGGSWDDAHVGYTDVIKDGSTYKMWYSGHDGSKWQIGYATSSDGISWTKYDGDGGPVLTPSTGKFDNNYVVKPTVIKEEDGATYRMWYYGMSGSTARIGYATSSDGTSWTKQNNGNAVLDVGVSGQFDDVHVITPSVWKVGNEFRMLYAGHDGSKYRIGYTVSDDGVSWKKIYDPGGVVFDMGTDGQFDDNHVAGPAVVVDGQTMNMWYYAKDAPSGKWRIGYAKSTDPLFWTRQNDGDPVLDLGSNGQWDDNYVLVPAVIKDGSLYKMWYTGQDGSLNRIGYATSYDGITWSKSGSNPVLSKGSGGSWDDAHVGYSWVMKDDSTYKMWYGGHDGAKWQIGYATSENGIYWEKYNGNGGPVLTPSVGKFDSSYVVKPTVIKDGSLYKMWYQGSDGSTTRIGYATSSNGITWIKQNSGNAVVDTGSSGQFDDVHVCHPTVWDAGYEFRMLYAGYDGQVYRIGYAVSNDGISWTKFSYNGGVVFEVGLGDKFDDKQVRDPSIIFDVNTYKMWYTGKKSGSSVKEIGYASSVDGVGWERQNSGEPVLTNGTDGSWDDEQVFEASVMRDDDTYKMWYTGYGGSGTNYALGYATSTDGINWTKFNSTGGPILENGTTGTFDSSGIRSPSVIKDEDTYKMWYSGYNSSGYTIGYAISYDGENWTKYGSNPILTPTSGKKDEDGVMIPSVYKDGGLYIMLYTGKEIVSGFEWHHRIFMAYSTDGITWEKMNSAIPVLDLGSSGDFDDYHIISSSIVGSSTGYKTWYSGADYTDSDEEYYYHYRIGYAYSDDLTTTSGSYLSKIHNLTQILKRLEDWGWSGSNPNTTTLNVQFRTSSDNATWSEWTDNLVNTTAGYLGTNDNYFQYRLNMSTGNSRTPVFNHIILNYYSYNESGYAISNATIAKYNITSVLSNWLANETFGNVHINISNNNGTDFYPLSNNVTYDFSTYDNYLKYRVDLTQTNKTATPYLEYLNITYHTEKVYPYNLSIDIGNDGDKDWNTTGNFTTFHVLSGSNLVNELNDLLSRWHDGPANIPIGIQMESPGNITIKDISISWESTSAHDNEIIDNTYGIYFENSNTTVSGNSIISNTYGIWFDSDSTANVTDSWIYLNSQSAVVFNGQSYVKDSTIYDNTIGVNVTGTTGTVISCEIMDNNWHSVISRSSGHLILENTVYNKHKVKIEDTSDILVKHHLSLKVLYPNGTNVTNPQIVIQNRTGSEEYNGTGNSNGDLVNISLKEQLITTSGITYYTPHTLTTDSNNNVTFVMDHSKYHWIYYGDDTDLDYRVDETESSPNILVYDAYYHEDAVNNVYLINDTFPTAGAGKYRLFIHAAIDEDTVPLCHINFSAYDLSDNVLLSTGTRPLSYFKWHLTPYFNVTTDAIRLKIGTDAPSKDNMFVDKIMLVRFNYSNSSSTGMVLGQITDPLNPDTDVDRILDGNEVRSGTFWWEAEDYPYDEIETQIFNDTIASNGIAIHNSSTNGETISITTNPENGEYQYYMKARLARRLEQYPSWNGSSMYASYSKAKTLAWGDMDLDGDLDLAVGNWGGKDEIYRNDEGVLTKEPIWTSYHSLQTASLAWGDIDGDDYPELVVGINGEKSQVLKNYEGVMESDDSPYWESGIYFVRAIDLGDMNGDGKLDLAIGGNLIGVFNNNGTTLESDPTVLTVDYDTYDIEWGDIDGDGDLDLVAGNDDHESSVFINNGTCIEDEPSWTSYYNKATHSIALGDFDNDGDLDLALGNYNGTDEIYHNNGSGLETDEPDWSDNPINTISLDWADIDNNGFLDLITTNSSFYTNRIFFNLGQNPSNGAEIFLASNESTQFIAPADVNNDGLVDLAMANYGSGSKTSIYYNSIGNLKSSEMKMNITGSVSRTVDDVFWLKPYYQWYYTDIFNVSGSVTLHVFDENSTKGRVVLDKVMLVNITQIYINETENELTTFNMTFSGDDYNNTHFLRIPQKANVTYATFSILGSSEQVDLPNSTGDDENDPDAYENLVVYNRSGSSYPGIYLYNISNDTEIQLSSAGERPRIYDNFVVWMNDTGGNGYDIYLYNISTGETSIIGSGANDQKNPEIWKGLIVWEDSTNHNIYLFSIENQSAVILNSDGPAYGPHIYENKIVWSDDRVGTKNIYLYDLSYSAEVLEKQERRISYNASYDETGPKIYGDRIVWFAGSGDLYLHQITTNSTTLITTIADSSKGLAFFGDKIAYIDTQADLWVYDISNEKNTEVVVGDTKLPSIDKDIVVWCDERGGDFEVYRLAQDLSLDIGDDGVIDWIHNEFFSDEDITNNLGPVINRYLIENQDQAQGGYISVSLNFSSTYTGFLNVTEIDIKLGWISEPLNPDSDADGIGDGKEVYGFHGYGIIETEDAFDMKEWANPYKDLTNSYEIETPIFIYQTGVSLTASKDLNLSIDDQVAGTGYIDSWIKVRTNIEDSGHYRLVINPTVSTTIFDTIMIKMYGMEVPLSIPTSSVSYQMFNYLYRTEYEEYLGKIVANATYINISREGGSEVLPWSGTVTETPVIKDCMLGTNVNGTPNNRSAILAFWKYSAEYNFTEDTDYIIHVGLDLSLIPDELRPDMKDQLGNQSEVPENLTFDEVEFVRLLDFDKIRIERTGTDPILYDTDEDGLGDGYEDSEFQYPLSIDPDRDGLTDYEEIMIYQTNSEYRDSDLDGIRDGVELGFNQSSLDGYTSSQGSWFERLARYDDPFQFDPIENYDADAGASTTDPLQSDSDGDGLPDGWSDGWRYEIPWYENFWRYDETYWSQSEEYDNILQIFEGEDLNLDGSCTGGLSNWGFDNLTFERKDDMTGETNASDPDTDGDGIPDGYEVYFSTLEPSHLSNGSYFLDPTDQTDGGEDNDVFIELNSTHNYDNGTDLYILNSTYPARAQMIPIIGTTTIENITKISVNLTADYSSNLAIEIWIGNNTVGVWKPTTRIMTISSIEEYWINGTWFTFDVKDAQFEDSQLNTYRYYIVVKYLGENDTLDEFNWSGNSNDQLITGNNYQCYYQNPNGDWIFQSTSMSYNIRLYGVNETLGGDGLTNLQEYIVGTNPRNRNTDMIKSMFIQNDDGLIDGDEIGESGDQVIFRTSVDNGSLRFASYLVSNISMSWIFYYGNGTNAGNYSYKTMVYAPNIGYSLSSADNIVVANLYDRAYVIFNRSSDEVYIASNNISKWKNDDKQGIVLIYDTDNVPDTYFDRDLSNDFRNQEIYKCDPLRWDTDGDSRLDGDISLNISNGEAPDWDGDFDGDGLIQARDFDSDNDGVSDYDELWTWDGQNVTVWNSESTYNALDTDSDNDNISDYIETYIFGHNDTDGDHNISIFDPDSDGDGVPDGKIDGWVYDPITMTGEIVYADGNITLNETEDLDCDGVVDTGESDPLDFDTDDDGVYDGYNLSSEALELHPQMYDYQWFYTYKLPDFRAGELNYSTDRTDPDYDNDGLLDGQEIYGWVISVQDNYTMPSSGILVYYGLKGGDITWSNVTSDPNDTDTDNDGLNDSQEYLITDPNLSDTDNDTLPDYDEITSTNTDPNDQDSDDDMLDDSIDLYPNDPDKDDDGLYDGIEWRHGANYTNDADTDDDNLTDYQEYVLLIIAGDYWDNEVTNVFLTSDSDGDTLLDGHDPGLDLSDYPEGTGLRDFDGDGLPNALDDDSDNDNLTDQNDDSPLEGEGEFKDYDYDGVSNNAENSTSAWGLDYANPDSDGDGLYDGNESYNIDTDGDGFYDGEDRDSDNDGLPDSYIDGWCYDWRFDELQEDTIESWGLYCVADGIKQVWEVEEWSLDGLRSTSPSAENVFIETDWRNPDSDGDGITDGNESIMDELVWTDWIYNGPIDPLNPDTDGDGLNDAIEIFNYSTNPTSNDTDSDGIDDYDELHSEIGSAYITNPTTPDTDEDGLLDGYDRYFGDMVFYGEMTSHNIDGKTTDPLRSDTDNDKLIDGIEVYGWKAITIDFKMFYDEIVKIINDTSEFNENWSDVEKEKYNQRKQNQIVAYCNVRWVQSNPNDYDSDGDSLNDYFEHLLSIDPNDIDSDNDGASDYIEYLYPLSDASVVDFVGPEISIVKWEKERFSQVIYVEYVVEDVNGIHDIKIERYGKEIISHLNLKLIEVTYKERWYLSDYDLSVSGNFVFNASDDVLSYTVLEIPMLGGLDIIGIGYAKWLSHDGSSAHGGSLAVGLLVGSYVALKEMVQSPMDWLHHPIEMMEGLIQISQLIGLNSTLFEKMKEAVYFQMCLFNPYDNISQPNRFNEFALGYYSGYLAGMIFLNIMILKGTMSVGKSFSEKFLNAAKVANGIAKPSKIAQFVISYAKMGTVKRILVTTALYSAAIAIGTVVAKTFFPKIFGNWWSTFKSVAFIIFCFADSPVDFLDGVINSIQNVMKRLGSKNLLTVVRRMTDDVSGVKCERVTKTIGKNRVLEWDRITFKKDGIYHEIVVTPKQYRTVLNTADVPTGKTGVYHAADYMENVFKKQEADDLVLVATSETHSQKRGFDLLYYSENNGMFYIVEVKESGISNTMSPKLGKAYDSIEMHDKWAIATLDENVKMGEFEYLRKELRKALDGKSSSVTYEKVYVTSQPKFPDKKSISNSFVKQVSNVNGHSEQSRIVQIYPDI